MADNRYRGCLYSLLTYFINIKKISAAQAAAIANAAAHQNIGHIIDGDEIETKHQPGNMIPPQHGHASQGGHSQQTHLLQTHQQVRNENILQSPTFQLRFKDFYYIYIA